MNFQHVYVSTQAKRDLEVPFHCNNFIGSLFLSRISATRVGARTFKYELRA